MPLRQAGGQPAAAKRISAGAGPPAGTAPRQSSTGRRGLFGMMPSSRGNSVSGVICTFAMRQRGLGWHGSATAGREAGMTGIGKLRSFVREMTGLAETRAPETRWLEEGGALLRDLIGVDDWLPEDCAIPGPNYRQYLLHCDPLERFCVVSFVWGPGQQTPVHDHLVWGLVGMLRGEEISTAYLPGTPMRTGAQDHLRPGQVVAVSPRIGDV